MARTEGGWSRKSGGFLQTAKNVAGILLEGVNQYLNFGSIFGAGGYGIRDNNGVIEYKNSTGDWTAMGQSELKKTWKTVYKNLESYDEVIARNATTKYTETKTFTVPGNGTIVATWTRDGNGFTTRIQLSGTGLPSGLTKLCRDISRDGDGFSTGSVYNTCP